MQIILTRLKLVNFKGIRELEIFPNQDVTTISGDNAKGKSTIVGAFSWLFTGKDQFDSAIVNEIKTYDADGKHIEQINHSVEATILIDGTRELTLKRVLRQNWVKRRGETELVLDGHPTDYFINGVACGTQREYDEELSKIIEDKTFKLLTNPLFFNDILEWKDRRDILFAMAPPITDDEIIDKIATLQNKDRVLTLTNILNSGASFERHKKDIAAKKKAKNEQLILIPAKVEATERTKPELPDGGFGVVEYQINKLTAEIKAIDIELSDKSKANEATLTKQREKQEFVHKLKTALQNARHSEDNKRKENRDKILDTISSLESKIKAEERSVESLQKDIDANTKEIGRLKERKEFASKRSPELEKEKQDLLKEFSEVDSLVFEFDADNCKCTSCDRPFTGEDLESKRTHYEAIFNKDKSDKLDRIDATGLVIKGDIDKYNKELQEFDKAIEELESKNITISKNQAGHRHELVSLNETKKQEDEKLESFDASTRATTEEEEKLSKQITEAEAPEETTTAVATEENPIILEKETKQKQLDALKVTFATKKQIEDADKLIEEYKADEKKLAQEVADLEKDEDIMQEFTRTRIESIETRISSMFKLVKFKLFDTKLNGEEKECFEATVGGVPFRILNTAMKVNAGLDVINVLSEHFDRTLPIFIDNRESISELIDTKAQIINLVKVKGQSTLSVE